MEARSRYSEEPGAYETSGESRRRVRVAISGSFKRHLDEIGRAIDSFSFLGAEVLSPQDNNIADDHEEFVFLESDLRRSIKGVESRHLAAIGNADVLYVTCADGYTGQSVCLEIGYAIAAGTPILASAAPEDMTIKQYVEQVAGPAGAIDWLAGHRSGKIEPVGLILLCPEQVAGALHDIVDNIETGLTTDRQPDTSDPVEAQIRQARRLLRAPGY